MDTKQLTKWLGTLEWLAKTLLAAAMAFAALASTTNALGIISVPSIEVARIWEGRSAIASEYSDRNRADTGAGENIARFSNSIMRRPSQGETV